MGYDAGEMIQKIRFMIPATLVLGVNPPAEVNPSGSGISWLFALRAGLIQVAIACPRGQIDELGSLGDSPSIPKPATQKETKP